MVKNKFISIEKYGKKYLEDILLPQAPSDKNNSYEALKFFFSKSFYRGRKDEISQEFQKRAIVTLDGYYHSGIISAIDDQELERSLCANLVNNHKDRDMVIASIKFVLKLDNSHNILTYAIDAIKKGRAENIYNELLDLPQIGPKLASLFLRDIVLLCDLKKHLTISAEKFLQPVDTWVKQVVKKLGIIGENDKDPLILSEKIVEECHKHSVCSLLFNAGSWYVGARSFELLLEYL